MTSQPERHAVVIGGSIAGLLAAQVLAPRFDQVTVIDRDRLPLTATPRRGVPQSVQPHVLFTRGYRILEELFPGIGITLEAAGAIPFNWVQDFRCFQGGHWNPTLEQVSGLKSYTCTRPLLESTIRQRVAQLPNVTLLENQRVVGLVSDRHCITGVRLDQRSHHTSETLTADLIVDASGRSTRLPQWLQALGYTPPPVTTVDPKLGYATLRCRLQRPPTPNYKILLINHQPPEQTRLGYLAQVEHGEWIATLGGYGQDYPPTEFSGFRHFARSLAKPDFDRALQDAEILSDIWVHRSTTNRLYHYEQIKLPSGLIAMGDSVCALCPVYGQGMTVSAISSLILRQWLSEQRHSPSSWNGNHFQKQLASSNSTPWSLATGWDSKFPTTEGAIPASWLTQLFQPYTNRLIERAHHNPTLYLQLFQMAHLLESPAILLRPQTLLQVLL